MFVVFLKAEVYFCSTFPTHSTPQRPWPRQPAFKGTIILTECRHDPIHFQGLHNGNSDPPLCSHNTGKCVSTGAECRISPDVQGDLSHRRLRHKADAVLLSAFIILLHRYTESGESSDKLTPTKSSSGKVALCLQRGIYGSLY